MPLEVDGEYRGAHAVHVQPHQKLGNRRKKHGMHRTVMTTALPLLNWLIDEDDLVRVVFGKLAHASGVTYIPRASCEVADIRIQVLLVDTTCAQSFEIVAQDNAAAHRIVARIRVRWEADTRGTPALRVVSEGRET